MSREVLLDIARGDNITLSTLHATVHLGAHCDAPSHYVDDGVSISEIELERYVGECQVIDCSLLNVDSGERRIRAGDLSVEVTAERVLLKTGSFPDPEHFNEDFAGLDPALVDYLADAGARLIGIDTPSVDTFSSKELPAHAACARRDVAILEGIVLANVDPGQYELIALPLKLVGFDASPVRAVLRG